MPRVHSLNSRRSSQLPLLKDDRCRGILDSLWRALFRVVHHAGSAIRIALIIVLSRGSVCQPIPVLAFLLRLVVTRVKAGYHASAPYIDVFMIHACTEFIIGCGPAPRLTLLIRRINCVSFWDSPHHSCTCCLNLSSESIHTPSHLIYGEGVIVLLWI